MDSERIKRLQKQINQIADCIRKFGFITPIVIDETKNIFAGMNPSKLQNSWLKECTLPRDSMGTALTIHQEHLTDNETRAYVIADNQLAELADLDDEPSTIELGEFSTLYLDFDITK